MRQRPKMSHSPEPNPILSNPSIHLGPGKASTLTLLSLLLLFVGTPAAWDAGWQWSVDAREPSQIPANPIIYRSAAVVPFYAGGMLTGLDVKIQDESGLPVAGRWPVMITLFCDSGCIGPGQHANSSEVSFGSSSGYVFLGVTDLDGALFVPLTASAINAGINIRSEVVAGNAPVVSGIRVRYADLMAGSGLQSGHGEQ